MKEITVRLLLAAAVLMHDIPPQKRSVTGLIICLNCRKALFQRALKKSDLHSRSGFFSALISSGFRA